MVTNIHLRRLPYFLIFVMVVLEAITVPLVTLMGHEQQSVEAMKVPWHGFLIGAIGTICIVCLTNQLLKKITVKINDESIKSIEPLMSLAFWGGCILFFIFLWQKILALVLPILPWVFQLAVMGFLSSFLTVFTILVLYNWITRLFPWVKISFHTADNCYDLKTISIFYLAFFVAIYEGLAMPVIWLIYHYLGSALLGGALGGLIGSGVVVLLVNCCLQNKITLSFSRR